ncbi:MULTISPECIES: helix-turn-helix domain-containing protein [Streptomyces]|uniref:Helix-turn-helix domain-containing protein n=1 Tax=Streptomyces dengpaensis TaxID=2049881 RepID=A0ABM6SR63_9ACTN|nr:MULTISPECIES: helix-turn-helix domain-containing protein [Streptomyces]AVH56962.1 helix-turn-helix domain-containing protein [Streptomyces dengpaensis]PIB09136.1 RNA polymerase subunit sigma-24 [Streptomyces sp. HG99]
MTQSPDTPLPPPKERRRLREAQSLTLAEFAAKVGVTPKTVRSWESGRTTPRGHKREAYAQLLTAAAELEADHRRPTPAETEVAARHEPAVPALVGAEASPAPAEEALAPAPAPTPTPTPTLENTKPTPPPLAPPPPSTPPTLTPTQAFDALYAYCAPALVRQAYLLTGRRELACESVERAFELAWHRWPEVAVDPDPAGWVRAATHEYALSPWHRLRPRHRHPEAPPSDAADRELLDVLLSLPPVHRRTLLLYEGVGLDLPETAAETEASTPATANRLLYAREAVVARLPELADPQELHRRLVGLAGTERLRAAKPVNVRWVSEARAQRWTRAAIAFTALLIGATALTLGTAPDHYEPPLAPGESVHDLPPRPAPGPLSPQQLKLQAKLNSQTANGPERLAPELG